MIVKGYKVRTFEYTLIEGVVKVNAKDTWSFPSVTQFEAWMDKLESSLTGEEKPVNRIMAYIVVESNNVMYEVLIVSKTVNYVRWLTVLEAEDKLMEVLGWHTEVKKG